MCGGKDDSCRVGVWCEGVDRWIVGGVVGCMKVLMCIEYVQIPTFSPCLLCINALYSMSVHLGVYIYACLCVWHSSLFTYIYMGVAVYVLNKCKYIEQYSKISSQINNA